MSGIIPLRPIYTMYSCFLKENEALQQNLTINCAFFFCYKSILFSQTPSLDTQEGLKSDIKLRLV